MGTFIRRSLAGPSLASHGALRSRLNDWLRDAREAGLEHEEIVALVEITLRQALKDTDLETV